MQGLKSIIYRYKNRQKDVKNNIGNGEAKELICTTHAHELRGVIAEGKGSPGQRGQRVKK